MSTNAAGRTVWNDKARSDLLQSIIDVAPPTSQQWEAIIAQLHAKGYTYNYSAALQHLQKLKRKDGGDAASNPSTPTKPKKTPAGSRKRKNAAIQDAEQDEDEKLDVKKPKLNKEAGDFDQDLEEKPVFVDGEA
ncbi:hypothetical protein F5B17DRAFT_436197 [Nemania serpens]|nr:hypothetical protein F5B17DRAFT_436197 [Nemania serpens]